jgi:hypothetical protein
MQKERAMSRNLKIKAGTFGLVLGGIGTLGQMLFVATRPGRRHPIEVLLKLSSSQHALLYISTLLVLIGGILGLYAAIRNDGRGTGLLAAALCVIVFLLIFTVGII